MQAPEQFVAWMSANAGFNPRSQVSSDVLTNLIIADLRRASPPLDTAISRGELTTHKTDDVPVGLATRNVDLTLRDPASRLVCAVENKSIMTAHGKARKNRYGDVIAYCSHVHQNRPDCIAAAVVVINVSPLYENPDGFAKGIERPNYNMDKIVPATVNLFAGIPQRELPSESLDRPEALGVILVEYDGVHAAALVEDLPGTAGVNYAAFLQRIGRLYCERFT